MLAFKDHAKTVGLSALLAAATALAGCTDLMKDETVSHAVPDKPSAFVPAPVEPVALEDGLVATAPGADGTAVCTVAGGDAGLTEVQAQAAFACLAGGLTATFADSSHHLARQFAAWTRVDRAPFKVAALDGRYAAVYANPRALTADTVRVGLDRAFAAGSTLAIPSFSVAGDGTVEPGPLYLVEKMQPGFDPLRGNWRYTRIATDGTIEAVSNGRNADTITLCAECTHEDADRLYLSLLNNGQLPL